MNLATAVVFFIYLQSQPLAPGNGGGYLQAWVLYGCPSEQLAREWALAQFAQHRLSPSVGIKELRVLPLGDILYTEDGTIPALWNALPRAEQWRDTLGGHDTYYILAPNKRPAPPAAGTPRARREEMQRSMANSADLNWDVDRSGYYIVFTRHQAVLIKEVNAPAAGIVYVPLVRGTPAGDETAGIWPWRGLTTYHQPASPALSPH